MREHPTEDVLFYLPSRDAKSMEYTVVSKQVAAVVTATPNGTRLKVLIQDEEEGGVKRMVTQCEPDPTTQDGPDSATMKLLSEFHFRVATTEAFAEKLGKAGIGRKASRLFTFDADVRVRVESVRRIKSTRAGVPHVQLTLRIGTASAAPQLKIFVAESALTDPAHPGLYANVLIFTKTTSVLIDQPQTAQVAFSSPEDFRFEFGDKCWGRPLTEMLVRILLGVATSCTARPVPKGDTPSYVIPVKQAVTTGGEEGANAQQPNKKGRVEDVMYKVSLLSLVTHSHHGAWVTTKVAPGSICFFEEKVAADYKVTPVALHVLSTAADFAQWADVLKARADELWLEALLPNCRGTLPLAPVPRERWQHLERVDSTHQSRAAMLLQQQVARPKADLAVNPRHQALVERQAKLDALFAEDQPTVANQPCIDGCLPPVTITVHADITPAQLVARLAVEIREPHTLYGLDSAEESDFVKLAVSGGYAPSILFVVIPPQEPAVILSLWVAAPQRTSATSTTWTWYPRGDATRVTHRLACQYLVAFKFHMNSRELRLLEDGTISLSDFPSDDIQFGDEQEELAQDGLNDDEDQPLLQYLVEGEL